MKEGDGSERSTRNPKPETRNPSLPSSSHYRVTHTSTNCAARCGVLRTAHGEVETPVFMPVGTKGTVKAVTQEDLEGMGFRIILGNTYHLYLRPGDALIREIGGLHEFISWPRAMLTDSGGFQVFSLQHIRRVGEDGVKFKSYIDGSEHLFTPERVMEIELGLGADVIMAFDECPGNPCPYDYARESMHRTHAWAERCKVAFHQLREEQAWPNPDPLLFGIVQGSTYEDLRAESAAFITDLDFPGNAVGGVSVGEGKEAQMAVMDWTVHRLPEGKPRYLMGLGTPLDVLDAVERGVDMMDCVLPTRLGRNGSAYTSVGRINIKGSRYVRDFGPLDPNCDCRVCTRYSAAYLRHLYKSDEMLAGMLLTYHNLFFYAALVEGARQAIRDDRFRAYKRGFEERYASGASDEASA
jgi:queuine tRNA-ribosyltransferase